jgi:hypothetical protein
MQEIALHMNMLRPLQVLVDPFHTLVDPFHDVVHECDWQ